MHGSKVATFYLLLVYAGASGEVIVYSMHASQAKPVDVDGRLCKYCEWSVVALARNVTARV